MTTWTLSPLVIFCPGSASPRLLPLAEIAKGREGAVILLLGPPVVLGASCRRCEAGQNSWMDNPDHQEPQSPDYLSLGKAFKQASPGAIATAIEKTGIFGWDRFGRWRQFKPDSKEAGRALDAIADVYDYESDPERSIRDEEHPLDAGAMYPGYLWELFGWPIGSVPEFVEDTPSRVPQTPARTAGETRRKQSYLKVIDALLSHIKLSADHRDTTGKVTRMVDLRGHELSDDTVRGILAETHSVASSRTLKD
jgi:hypothetical protein